VLILDFLGSQERSLRGVHSSQESAMVGLKETLHT
jgi:hypothetical protein